MSFLKLADTSATQALRHESGDFLEVRSALSKREINMILGSLPSEMFQTAGKAQFGFNEAAGTAEALFKALVVAWSLPDPATTESYLALEGEPAAWVDKVLFEHFDSLQMGKDESPKPMTSARGSRKATG